MDSVDRLRSELLTGFHIKAKAAQEKDRASQVDEADCSMEYVLKRLAVALQKQHYRNFGMYRQDLTLPSAADGFVAQMA